MRSRRRLSGYDFGTGRNWARLGQLYLQDGVWNDERLLPEGFVDFVSSPAPAWDRQQYGGFFWLNRTGWWTRVRMRIGRRALRRSVTTRPGSPHMCG